MTPSDVDARHIPHIMLEIIPCEAILMAFLVYDFFHGGIQAPGMPGTREVPFWLEDQEETANIDMVSSCQSISLNTRIYPV